MSFFDLSKYHRNDYEIRKLHEEKQQLEQELKDRQWRERSAGYERERQHYREQERKEQQRENDREWRWNNQHEKERLREVIEDLKLRHKFGIEEGE